MELTSKLGRAQTYHVDCQGYDIDGTLIFPELNDCWGQSLRYYERDNQMPTLTASTHEFNHCSQCGRCKRFEFSELMVSYKTHGEENFR